MKNQRLGKESAEPGWWADCRESGQCKAARATLGVVSRLIVDAAKSLTSQIFARIPVRLQWYGPPVCPAGAADPIFVTFQTRTPEAQFPGALGVALPLEGSHAWVFYDRVLRAGPEDSRRVVALLAHVMAHDAHLLQGIIGTLRAEC